MGNLLHSIGEKAENELPVLMRNLHDIILKYDPILLLSFFAHYGLATPLGEDPELTQKRPVLQHHIELLQSFILMHKQEEFACSLAMTELEKIFDMIEQISRAYSFRMYKNINLRETDENIQQFVLENVRMNTQAVRNWGYPEQIMRFTTDIYNPLDTEIEKFLGVRVGNLIKMLDGLIKYTEEKANNHRISIASVISEKSAIDLISKYYSLFPSDEDKQEEERIAAMMDLIKKEKIGFEKLRFMMLNHSHLFLPDLYAFDLNDFLKFYPTQVDNQRLIAIIESWSIEFGNLSTMKEMDIFLDNPIWKKPMIKYGKIYFWPILNTFLSFCTNLMENLIKSNDSLYKKYTKSKARFLENRVQALFTKNFPSSNICRGYKWVDKVTKKTLENDLFIVQDSLLIIVESKSGKMTDPAKRGASLSYEGFIQNTLIDASAQINNFEKYIRSFKENIKFIDILGAHCEFNPKNINEFIKVIVTYELFGNIYTRFQDLQKAKFIQQSDSYYPMISLADLEIIFEILEGPCQLIHYFKRRMDIEKNTTYVGDEMDLLANYLQTGFNGEEFNEGKCAIILTPSGKSFDPYFMGKQYGENIEKPKLTMTERWHKMIKNLQIQKNIEWLEVGILLLNVPYQVQMQFENRISKILNRNKAEVEKKSMESVFWGYGPQRNRNVLIGLPYSNILNTEWKAIFNNLVKFTLEKENVDRFLVIGIDIINTIYPYNFVTLIKKPKI
jgi:hypothetical protein